MNERGASATEGRTPPGSYLFLRRSSQLSFHDSTRLFPNQNTSCPSSPRRAPTSKAPTSSPPPQSLDSNAQSDIALSFSLSLSLSTSSNRVLTSATRNYCIPAQAFSVRGCAGALEPLHVRLRGHPAACVFHIDTASLPARQQLLTTPQLLLLPSVRACLSEHELISRAFFRG